MNTIGWIIVLSVMVITDVISYLQEETKFSIISLFGSISRGFFIGIGAVMLYTMIVMNIEGRKPEAIDVYRGDTKLEITYADSIPVDTTVVWKDGKKREW